MDMGEAIAILRRFNRKATEVEQSKTYQTLLHGDAGIHLVDLETGETCVEWYGLDDDSLHLLTSLRFFMLDKDGISLRKMAELYSGLSLTGTYAADFAEVRANINRTLDRPIYQYGNDGPVSTFRDLINTLTYGRVVHEQPKEYAEVESWGPVGLAFRQYFMWQAVQQMMYSILYIRSMNEAAIAAMAAYADTEAGATETRKELSE